MKFLRSNIAVFNPKLVFSLWFLQPTDTACERLNKGSFIFYGCLGQTFDSADKPHWAAFCTYQKLNDQYN